MIDNPSVRLADLKVNFAIVLVIVALLVAIIGGIIVRREHPYEKPSPMQQKVVDQKKLDDFRL